MTEGYLADPGASSAEGAQSVEQLRAELRALAPWHLDVELRDGVSTADAADVPGPPEFGRVSFVAPRPSFQAQIRRLFPEGLQGRTFLDCACNCGGYAFWAKELGAGDCFGFDVREHWIRQAEFLSRTREQPSDGLEFAVCDLYDLPRILDRTFDVSIFKGVFYHLPDPIEGLKIVADRTDQLLWLNTATLASHADGALVVAGEPAEALMSGVYGLNWYPAGPEVLRRILTWLGFPETRLVYWHRETAFHGGGRPLGRLELLAARSEAVFEHYDRVAVRAAPEPRQAVHVPSSSRLKSRSFHVARRVWWALPRRMRDFVRPILFPSARPRRTPNTAAATAERAPSPTVQEAAAAAREGSAAVAPDGLPVPPYDLLAQVIGVRGTAEQFLSSGALALPIMTEVLRRNGFDPGAFEQVLEWGCGCGRVLRYWQDVDGPRVYGCDLNPDLVRWCQQNLPFAGVSPNGVAPPLPFAPESFDFVYALSVFTHLTEELQLEWMREIRRILKPGGLFMFTTVGPAEMYLERMTPAERERFDAGELVVRSEIKRDGGQPGSQNFATWHPRSWVEEKMLDGFELLDFEPEGAECNGRQDAWLVRKNRPGSSREPAAAAPTLPVDLEIHPDDEMFRGNLDGYVTAGRSALHVIESALESVGAPEPEAVLDLPCGHGRVMRHLRARWPSARIVACDLSRSGVDFCATKFGAVPVYSRIRPAEIPIDDRFDLIWVGSLLTHLDAPLWRGFLDFFTDRLTDRGLLIFTTCGRYVAHRERAVPTAATGFAEGGFGYYEPSGSRGYGTAYASPEWVTGLLSEYPNRLVTYWERAWNDHQDVVVLSAERYDSPWRRPL